MSDLNWLTHREVMVIQDEVLEKDGGAQGVRDDGLLQSALARPQNLHAYGENNLFQLAASYAESIASNHAFVDGNKRTALVSAMHFLEKNGQSMSASRDFPDRMVALASGGISREDFADHLQSCAIEHNQGDDNRAIEREQRVQMARDHIERRRQERSSQHHDKDQSQGDDDISW